MSIDVTYTFVAMTIARASEVNQNFTDLRDSIRGAHHQDADGTKLVNADIDGAAAIAWTKISKSGSVLNDVGDVVITGAASQDIIIRNASNQWVNKAKGSDGEVLTMASGVLDWLPQTVGSRLLHTVTSEIALGYSVTETSLLSFTLPGGLLSTNKAVNIKLFCGSTTWQNTNETKTWRLKYGSTTVQTATLDSYTGSGLAYGNGGLVEFWLMADGATDAQVSAVSTNFVDIPVTWGRWDNGLAGFTFFKIDGSAAEDSTGDLTVEVTCQQSNTAAGYSELRTVHSLATLITG